MRAVLHPPSGARHRRRATDSTALTAHWDWERRHPCRRVARLIRKLAGKDAGAPSIQTGSRSQCMLLKKERRLSMKRFAAPDLEGWSSSFSLPCTTTSQNKLKLELQLAQASNASTDW